MKKVGDLFAELGFREDGSESVKRAFVENLVRAAGGAPVSRRTAPVTSQAMAKTLPGVTDPKSKLVREEQLSFDFSSENLNEPEIPFPLATKKTAG